MESNIDYILFKSDRQKLLKSTIQITVVKGFAQFKRKGVKKDKYNYTNINVDEILNLNVDNRHTSIKLLKSAINDVMSTDKNDKKVTIKVYGNEIAVCKCKEKTSKTKDVKESGKFSREFSNNWKPILPDNDISILKSDDALYERFSSKEDNPLSMNEMPIWLRYNCDEPIRLRILLYSKQYIYNTHKDLFDFNKKSNGQVKDLQYNTKILRNVQYVDGYDKDINFSDENSIYYYRTKSTIKQKIDKMIGFLNTNTENRNTKEFNAFVDYLFNESLALFYCNLSHGLFTIKEYQEYGIEIMWYLMCNIVSGTGAMCAANKDWIRDFDIKLLFTRFYKKVLGAKNNWGKYLKRIWRTSISKCMYPKGTSSKDKEAWKKSKGIVRKAQDKSKRKVQDKSKRKKHKAQDTTKRKQTVKSREQFVKEVTLKIKVNKLREKGLSIRNISRELNISVNTVQKHIIK